MRPYPRRLSRFLLVSALLCGTALAGLSGHAAPVRAATLKAAHAYSTGLEEVRNRMMDVLARSLERQSGSLRLKIYPQGRLFSEDQLWPGLTDGTLELALMPLSRLAGIDPVFALPSLPGLEPGEASYYGMANSPLMTRVKTRLADFGVRVLADLWVPGVLVSDGDCRRLPRDLEGRDLAQNGQGLAVAASARPVEARAAGPDSALAQLADGRADVAAVTVIALSSDNPQFRDLTSVCVTRPGDLAIWYDYQPVLMADRAWMGLSAAQQDALRISADEAVAYAREALRRRVEGLAGRLAGWEMDSEPVDRTAWEAWSLRTSARLDGVVDRPVIVEAPPPLQAEGQAKPDAAPQKTPAAAPIVPLEGTAEAGTGGDKPLSVALPPGQAEGEAAPAAETVPEAAAPAVEEPSAPPAPEPVPAKTYPVVIPEPPSTPFPYTPGGVR